MPTSERRCGAKPSIPKIFPYRACIAQRASFKFQLFIFFPYQFQTATLSGFDSNSLAPTPEQSMAVQTSPSLTSTSHTLTAAPIMGSSDSNSHVLALLESLRQGNRHAFLQPTASIPTDSLNLVKNTLEGFASQVGDEQQERLKENRKRKRAAASAEHVLKIRKVYVDGFETGQVWQQAKRIIGSVLKYSEEALAELEERDEIVTNGVDAQDSKLIEFGEDGFEVGSDEEDDGSESGSGESDEDAEEDDEELSGDELENGLEEGSEDGLDEPNDDNQEEDDEDDEEEAAEEYTEDPDGLNDGFFSIDDFNKQTQWFEDQDARGDPNTDQASDDEQVDWDADPFAPSNAQSKTSKKSENDAPLSDEEEDDDEEAGPTFGDMALDAPEGESEDEDFDEDVDDEANDMNANDVYYKDFFAPPPPRKFNGNGKPRKAVHFEPKQPDETDVQRAMDDVRRDLFDDESEVEDSEDALSDVSAGDPKSRRSAHERRQAKLAEEIRKLEAASVAKREWAMAGEAAATDRPVNSLLEEDLDFEHVGKPVPVITPEITESIEDLIKRRILAQEFDEIIRRRPDAEAVPAGTRRGLVELDDSKAEKGLAEIYEEEHIKNTNPDAYVSQSDEKLQREEKEIENMWRDVSARLDSLSSWHYKPKPVAPAISVVADVATVAMEDAQPTTAQGVAGEASRMAPQEVYKTGASTAAHGEVVTKGGMPLARQELSREDKARRRRREKERVRKAGGVDGNKVVSKRARMQRDTIAELKKGGVKVINRKGEITDVDGKKAKAAKVVTSGGFKL